MVTRPPHSRVRCRRDCRGAGRRHARRHGYVADDGRHRAKGCPNGPDRAAGIGARWAGVLRRGKPGMAHPRARRSAAWQPAQLRWPVVPDSAGKVDEAGNLGEASNTCADGSGDGIESGSVGWVTITLTSGHYELVCNLTEPLRQRHAPGAGRHRRGLASLGHSSRTNHPRTDRPSGTGETTRAGSVGPLSPVTRDRRRTGQLRTRPHHRQTARHSGAEPAEREGTVVDATPRSEDFPRSAACHQRDGRVQLGAW